MLTSVLWQGFKIKISSVFFKKTFDNLIHTLTIHMHISNSSRAGDSVLPRITLGSDLHVNIENLNSGISILLIHQLLTDPTYAIPFTMSHSKNQISQNLSPGVLLQMATEMYNRRIVKSQAAATAMIPMDRSTFNYRYNGGNV
jgi:hypothetical protein